jgi:oligosaccharide repeat unit polymerase
MLGHGIINSVLFFCVLNTFVFLITLCLLLHIFKLPIYHIMTLYILYFFGGFVVRPWELYLEGTSPLWDYIGTTPTSGDVLWAAIVVILAHASMLAGFLLTHGHVQVPTIRPFSFAPKRPLVFYAVVLTFLLAGAYATKSTFADVTDLKDVTSLEQTIDSSGGLRNENVSGYQTIFAELIPVTLLLLFATRRMRTVAVASVAAFVIYRSFAGAERSSFVVTILAVCCILLIEARRRYPPLRLIAAGILVLVLFNIIGSDRMAVRRLFAGEASFSEVLENYWDNRGDAAVTADMQEFDVLVAVLSVVPERAGYTYGTQYLRLLIWPIPRQLWPDKPVYTSIVNLVDYGNFEFLTITLFADSYISLGVPGMIIVLFLISIALNNLYLTAVRGQRPVFLLTYFCVLMYSPIIFRDGPVSAAYFILVATTGGFAMLYFGDVRNAGARNSSAHGNNRVLTLRRNRTSELANG